MKCFYCGRKGHTKKKSFQFEFHKALSLIKGIKGLEPKKIQKDQKINR